MDNELKQYLDSKFQYIDSKFAESRAEFRAELEATETRLLSEFGSGVAPLTNVSAEWNTATQRLSIVLLPWKNESSL